MGDVAKSSLETAPLKRLYHYWTRNTDTHLFAQDYMMTDPVLSCHVPISFPSVTGRPFNSVTGLPDCTSAANRTSSNRTGGNSRGVYSTEKPPKHSTVIRTCRVTIFLKLCAKASIHKRNEMMKIRIETSFHEMSTRRDMKKLAFAG